MNTSATETGTENFDEERSDESDVNTNLGGGNENVGLHESNTDTATITAAATDSTTATDKGEADKLELKTKESAILDTGKNVSLVKLRGTLKRGTTVEKHHLGKKDKK